VHVLKFIEPDTGSEHLFDDFGVVPLGYDELKILPTERTSALSIPLVATPHLCFPSVKRTSPSPPCGQRASRFVSLRYSVVRSASPWREAFTTAPLEQCV